MINVNNEKTCPIQLRSLSEQIKNRLNVQKSDLKSFTRHNKYYSINNKT